MKKRMLSTFGTMVAVTAPIVTVISCADETLKAQDLTSQIDGIGPNISELKKLFISKFDGKFKDAQGGTFDKSADFTTINSASDFNAIKQAAEAIHAFTEGKATVNTIIVSDAKVGDIDLGKFAAQNTITIAVKSAGNALVPSVPENPATSVANAEAIKQINAAADKAAVNTLLSRWSLNATTSNTTAIQAVAVTGDLPATKTLAITAIGSNAVYVKDSYKPGTSETPAQNTILEVKIGSVAVSGKDIDLGKFTANPVTTFTVKTSGNAGVVSKQISTTNMGFPTDALKAEIQELIKLFDGATDKDGKVLDLSTISKATDLDKAKIAAKAIKSYK